MNCLRIDYLSIKSLRKAFSCNKALRAIFDCYKMEVSYGQEREAQEEGRQGA